MFVAQDAPAKEDSSEKKVEQKKTYVLRHRLKQGARYVGSNSVSFDLKTKVRRGQVTEESRESVERTERFRDRQPTPGSPPATWLR